VPANMAPKNRNFPTIRGLKMDLKNDPKHQKQN
jgi:hypothetical protein